ncbi:LysR family transcriptional regulator [Novosphingobium resinovorum]|uniref:HTH lysR-type domain-containing protein n=1 Tax=Novosphingobium resinovorum TaxID=158500 RepID=A0A1D8AEE6_9SPHN|nr:LysR family transcriptional regulator [Novosphingobium resinovorum]AOR80487.1 hypothetical protein BES08_26895 [Novosphingobium resinovorum]
MSAINPHARNLSRLSVSSTIALRERRLGVVLFERRRGGIALTHECEVLRRRAEALSTLLADAASEVERARHDILGLLRLFAGLRRLFPINNMLSSAIR